MSDRETIRVRDIMKRKFDIIDGMATIKEALDTMQYVETKVLVVKKRHADDEYGLLMIPDIAREVLARDRSPERVNVYEVMSKPVVSVDADMDIRYCARLFSRLNISRAPVLDNREVVGIISLTDMVLRGMCRKDNWPPQRAS